MLVVPCSSGHRCVLRENEVWDYKTQETLQKGPHPGAFTAGVLRSLWSRRWHLSRGAISQKVEAAISHIIESWLGAPVTEWCSCSCALLLVGGGGECGYRWLLSLLSL